MLRPKFIGNGKDRILLNDGFFLVYFFCNFWSHDVKLGNSKTPYKTLYIKDLQVKQKNVKLQ